MAKLTQNLVLTYISLVSWFSLKSLKLLPPDVRF